MSTGTNIIYAPVTMPQDIAQILHISGTSLEAVCTSQAINMWAKYKPIEYNKKGMLTLAERASRNFGIINIPTWGNINKMANFWFGIDTSSTNAPDIGIQPIYWGYQKPSGYKRLSDFSEYPVSSNRYGYFHEAEAQIGRSMYGEYTIDSQGNLRIIFNHGGLDARTIRLDELTYPTAGFNVGNMYFGCLLRKVGQNDFYAVTGPKISNVPSYGAYVDISGLTTAFNGEYEIFPMASADQIPFTSDTGQMTNGKWIALGEKETVGIGATIVRINIREQSFAAYRDTSQSTRNLFVNLTLVNDEYQGGLGANVVLDVFNSSGSVITTVTRSTPAAIPAGGDYLMKTQIDMGSLSALRSAFSVRAKATPDITGSTADTFALTTVTDGPSPYT